MCKCREYKELNASDPCNIALRCIECINEVNLIQIVMEFN